MRFKLLLYHWLAHSTGALMNDLNMQGEGPSGKGDSELLIWSAAQT